MITVDGFYGRENELKALIEAWSKAKIGSAQWVNIIAESGVGKTRLVQEFYKLLSNKNYQESFLKKVESKLPVGVDSDDYWPESLPIDLYNLGINPKLDSFARTHSSIPWFWWGIRGIDVHQRNSKESLCALSDSLGFFTIHIKSLVIKKIEFEPLLKEGAKKILSNLVPGLDLLLNIAELAKAGEPILKIFKDNNIGVNENRKTEEVALHAKIKDGLFQFLEADVPVILILDDIQFFDEETSLCIESLIVEAKVKNLKLMIISTCWKKEWEQSELESIKNLKQLTDETQPGGFKGEYQEITFSKSLEEDSKLYLNENLPGLTPNNAKLIANRADGNWRYLTELVMMLKEDSNYFIGGDFESDLSTSGIKATNSNAVSMDELIRKRFLRLDKDVQLALKTSSFQGVKFSPALTTQVVPKLNESCKDVMAAINKAENPGSMITTADNNSKEFLQRPYWKIVEHKLNEDEALFKDVKSNYKSLIDFEMIEHVPLNSYFESLIVQFYSTEDDIKYKIKLLSWLIHKSVSDQRFQAGKNYLNSLFEINKNNETALIEIVDEIPYDFLGSILKVINYFGFNSDKNSEELGERLIAKIRSYWQEKFHEESLANSIEVSLLFLKFHQAFGHIKDSLEVFEHVINLQTELLNANTSAHENLRAELICNNLQSIELEVGSAKNKEQWGLIYSKYSIVFRHLNKIEDKNERSIFRAWNQISALYYGQEGRKYYPVETQWGDDYHFYCNVAESIGNIIADLEYDQNFDEFVGKSSDETLVAILTAGWLTIEFALIKNYDLTLEFIDRLTIIADSLEDQVKKGAYINTTLFEALIKFKLNKYHFLFKRQHGNSPSKTKEQKLNSIEQVESIYLVSRNINESEYEKESESIQRIIKIFSDYAVMSLDMRKEHARFMWADLVYKNAGQSLDYFNQILTYATQTKDGDRMSFGEPVQFLEFLVKIYDDYIKNSEDEQNYWNALENEYHDELKFIKIVELIRSA